LVSPLGSGLAINFFSDNDANPGSLGQCFTPPVIVPCNLVENGAVQTAAQISWSDGTVDTIQFQSDVAAEPSSWLLLLIGLGLVRTLKTSAGIVGRNENGNY